MYTLFTEFIPFCVLLFFLFETYVPRLNSKTQLYTGGGRIQWESPVMLLCWDVCFQSCWLVILHTRYLSVYLCSFKNFKSNNKLYFTIKYNTIRFDFFPWFESCSSWIRARFWMIYPGASLSSMYQHCLSQDKPC